MQKSILEQVRELKDRIEDFYKDLEKLEYPSEVEAEDDDKRHNI